MPIIISHATHRPIYYRRLLATRYWCCGGSAGCLLRYYTIADVETSNNHLAATFIITLLCNKHKKYFYEQLQAAIMQSLITKCLLPRTIGAPEFIATKVS
jgi:hypothetical protein